MTGKVFLVGAGPGDPELLTLKARRLLRSADVVLHDDLVGPEVLNLLPPTTIVHNVGKRCGEKKVTQEQINSMMVSLASDGLIVVRLKSGDPSIFGRLGEEIDALRNAHIDFEIIPGITAAAAAAAAARISLTDRRAASKLIFSTGHRAFGRSSDANSIEPNATLALYMPGDNYSSISAQLQDHGLPAETPCVLISQATSETQQIHRSTIGGLRNHTPLPAPTLLIVGAVTNNAVTSPSPYENQPALVNCWSQL